MGRHLSNHSPSPDRGRGSPRRRRSPPPAERSPTRHRSSRGDISPSPVALKKNSRRDSSPSVKEKRSVESKSPRRERSGSPSPRTKRLRQALAEKEVDRRTDRDHGRNHERVKDRANHRDKEGSKVSERERERSHEKGGERGARKGRDDEMVIERENDKNRGRGSDRTTYKDRDTDKGNRADRKEKSHGRDEIEEKPSRGRHEHSASPSDRRHRRRRSHSPQTLDDNRQHDEVVDDSYLLGRNDEDDSVAKMKAAEEALEAKKQKPSFELSGKLAEETNRFRGITLLFNEPPEARKPTIRWRLYVFKGGEVLNEPLYIHRQSCYLFGRERRVADIPTDHPSCSKQHAVIQYRQIEQEGADGTISKQVRPYIMDLGSTNKTFINESAIEPQRYYELFERDTIKFGNSSREYVLLHENSSEA
ncbi:FHA domain-containing protein DDL [Linum perenne]